MTELRTFPLPPTVEGSDADRLPGQALIAAWQVDAIFQIQATPDQDAATGRVLDASEADEFIDDGTHFTTMFMRCYPDRSTTARIGQENRTAARSGSAGKPSPLEPCLPRATRSGAF
ncbi:hypothetical protein [Streptomyces lacrimifluminis]|nr:hypothetical protein [Streptomyces lacrimifluminis]